MAKMRMRMRKKPKKPKRWIAGAIEKPGALTATAKRAGAVDKKGRIKLSWLQAKKDAPGKLGKRVRLALTLRKMRK